MDGSKVHYSVVLEQRPRTKRLVKKWLAERWTQLETDTKDVPVTVIVRNRNEAPKLERLLSSLRKQTYSADIELLVVDTESADNSRQIALKYGATILAERQATFTYPKSLNKALKAAKHEVVIITVTHALPHHNYWLRAAAHHFADPQVAGVFAKPTPDTQSRWHEQLGFYLATKKWPRVPKSLAKAEMGTLGATNCVIRRSLWQRHPFDEAYEAGGEDTAWAAWALSEGYKIIEDSLFAVHHTHRLRLHEHVHQYRLYKRMTKGPQSKSQLSPYVKRRFQ